MRHAVVFWSVVSAIGLASVFNGAPARGDEDAVMVTAPRFEEDARRLPASVTVLNAEDIARSAARTPRRIRHLRLCSSA